MKELSVFIDESGDFGVYQNHAPYYIVTLILHNQSKNISESINKLNSAIQNTGFDTNHSIHTGPLIRRESDYFHLELEERRYLFNCLFNFARTTEIQYKTIVVNKKELKHQFDLNARVSKQLSLFINDNMDFFFEFDKVVLYYDNGQTELTKRADNHRLLSSLKITRMFLLLYLQNQALEVFLNNYLFFLFC